MILSRKFPNVLQCTWTSLKKKNRQITFWDCTLALFVIYDKELRQSCFYFKTALIVRQQDSTNLFRAQRWSFHILYKLGETLPPNKNLWWLFEYYLFFRNVYISGLTLFLALVIRLQKKILVQDKMNQWVNIRIKPWPLQENTRTHFGAGQVWWIKMK